MQRILQFFQKSLIYIGICAIFGMGILTNCSRIIPCRLYSGLEPVQSSPEQGFLKGRYIPDSKTIERMKFYKGIENSYMNINSNGTYEIKNIPAVTLDLDAFYEEEIMKNIDAGGNWKLVIHDNAAYLSADVDFKKDQTNAKGYGTSWKVFSKNEKAVIVIPVGDPDGCEFVRFIKE